ncbi:MAG: tRNA (N(6)-L-threonylcarbamoyladenosine(37)-C(2))-methylthiotransferase MtaB [Lachnospiraceae bacterium]|nr:tRNA (N(6)-L-threonylcarbamoyladenosine(37)-C(2))-methylthiotransferase MtaB [Lachnospiraceae bacterium]
MKSVAFHNLGCKVNGYEMDFMQQTLQEKGYKIVPFDKKADIYIINTCTVTNIADRKSRQMLHRAKKMNPDSVVVAVGCYVQAGKEEALKDMSIDLAIGNNKKKDLVEILEEYLQVREKALDLQTAEAAVQSEDGTGALKETESTDEESVHNKTLQGKTIIDINHTDEYESMQLKTTAEHTRAFIKVQDGCNQFCSYCIIPYARGRIRSRDLEEVLQEVRGLAENGYREVVLTGIHLSSYGMTGGTDFSKSKLLDLIRAVNEVDGIDRIRLGSLEPRIITEAFTKGLAECEKICPHFHLSLQSGSKEVLKRMNRKYTPEEYYEKVCILRKYFDNPAITTDVIVGFPQETEEEFAETERFLEKIGFYEMHIFKYSKRQGTPAAVMEGQVPEEIKALRSNRLLELEERMSAEYRKAHLHKETSVLFEEEKRINGKVYQIGHTAEYIKAAFETGENVSGQIVKGVLTDFVVSDILLFTDQIH